jgi:predicted amidohydrolase YtcJ
VSDAASTSFSFVVTNAHVYADGIAPDIDAVAVRETKIAALGRTRDLGPLCTAPCSVVDAKGGFLSPGFHDAHVHLAMAGEEEAELLIPLRQAASIPKIQAAVAQYAAAHPDDPWILGHGWNAAGLATLPTRFDLDTAERSRPVALTDHTGHNLWVNSAAIAAAGITKSTPDPFGGTIVRDANGEPTGVFLDGAQSLIAAKRPTITEEQRTQYILAGEKTSLAAACTSMQGGPVPLDVAKTYARLDQQGMLSERAFLWAPLLAKDPDFQAWLAFAKSLPRDGKVQVVAFKGFADGTFATSTAALLAPYADNPSSSGQLYVSQDVLSWAVLRANRAGFPAAIHAIGDRAVRSALDAFALSKRTLSHGLMNRVEHASMVDAEDAKRFGPLGVAASVQPVWLYEYSSRSGFGLDRRVGAARVAELYRWNDLARSGAFLLFGSDLPSSDLDDPLTGIFAAANRQFWSGETLTPDQRIDPDLALRAYTTNPAVAIGWGDRIGKIAAGYEADFVILDRDPRSGSKGLADNTLRRTWIAGRVVER